MFRITRLPLTLATVLLWALPATAQPSLRVSLTCDACDRAALQRAVPFVTILPVTESESTAEATVVITATSVSVRGQGRFEGRDRTVMVSDDHARSLKLLLAEYAAETDAGRHLDVQFSPPAPSAAAGHAPPAALRDPWNAWVFRVNGSVYLNGEESASDSSSSYRVSANRTTERWKLRVSSYRSVSRSSFKIDSATTITSRLSDWNVEGLAVKSLGPRWSVGVTSSVVGSSFSNSRRVARVEPGLEFDWFPYAESSRRSLTFMYSVGVAHYDYDRETIFDKLQETVGTHSLRSALGLRQPWGQVGASLQLAQQLTAPDRTRIVLNSHLSVRLLRSLTLTSSGTYSRLRDQFTLVKGNATDEEVLLRQRQLATGYRYSFSVGFGYAFGALGNTTVNPRFGGG